MVVGIPKALLYWRYKDLWIKFFQELNIKTLISPDTDKDILKKGLNIGIDEGCLSGKVYLGHIQWLIDKKVDYIFIPRVSYYDKQSFVCTKFRAMYDVVNNTFRHEKLKLLSYNIDAKRDVDELQSFKEMAKDLKKTDEEIEKSYYSAKKYYENKINEEVGQQKLTLSSIKNKLKIMLVGHSYNIYDAFIGKPITEYLLKNGCYPIYADLFDRKKSKDKSNEISPTLKYEYNKELLGSTFANKDKVDGIILISSFPCGPDSMTNDMIIRKLKDKPIINLIIDEQEGMAGRETRLESFIDIIRFKKGGKNA
ncbi:MAG: acyl-CoA dehydratase activase-related protein [Mycoplasmataceae bacterium]|nr:acyl-CoA dehydratase activase-related protein [Mycoplasmataceae bacterium]